MDLKLKFLFGSEQEGTVPKKKRVIGSSRKDSNFKVSHFKLLILMSHDRILREESKKQHLRYYI